MGRFIVLEGGEAAGKSTQAALLAGRLSAVLTREPGGTAVGEALRRLLLDLELAPVPKAEVLLILAARAQHVAEVIEPALARGDDVVCDRYSGSTLAYQGYGRGLPLAELREMNNWATGTEPPTSSSCWTCPSPSRGKARLELLPTASRARAIRSWSASGRVLPAGGDRPAALAGRRCHRRHRRSGGAGPEGGPSERRMQAALSETDERRINVPGHEPRKRIAKQDGPKGCRKRIAEFKRGLAGLVGQDVAVATLRAAAARPVHAYLFVGPPGTGKLPAAMAFAAMLLCPGGGEDGCETCRRVLDGCHPDVWWWNVKARP